MVPLDDLRALALAGLVLALVLVVGYQAVGLFAARRPAPAAPAAPAGDADKIVEGFAPAPGGAGWRAPCAGVRSAGFAAGFFGSAAPGALARPGRPTASFYRARGAGLPGELGVDVGPAADADAPPAGLWGAPPPGDHFGEGGAAPETAGLHKLYVEDHDPLMAEGDDDAEV